MSKITSKTIKRSMRHRRVRAKVKGTAERPRLAVFRSNKFIYASLVDDAVGKTLTTVSSAKVAVKGKETFRKVVEATKVGETIGAFAKKAGIAKVVFDRGGFRFTGRVKAVADGARAAGLEF